MAILTTGVTKVSGKVADTGGEVVLTAADVGAVAKAGDTMSGPLTVNAPLTIGSPSSHQSTSLYGILQVYAGNYGCRVIAASNRGYFQAGNAVDTTQPHQMTLSGWSANPLDNLEIKLKGGSIWFNSDSTITANVAPTAPAHLVNKAYADTKASLAGSTMTGQLSSTATFEASTSNAQIFHDGKGAANTQINIRSMREAAGATWLWEKVAGGNLYYSTGTNGAGTNKIRMAVSAGEIYLGDANKRVYHEGNKPTPADVGARPSNWLPSLSEIGAAASADLNPLIPAASASFVYTGSTLTQMTEQLTGGERVTSFAYTDGRLTTAVEVLGSVTKTTTFNYQNGTLTGFTTTEVVA